MGQGSGQGSVTFPVYVAAAFVIGSFICGYYSGAVQNDSEQTQVQLPTTKLPVNRRALVTAEIIQAPQTAKDVDPLDPASLERYMLEESGLLQVRPPVPFGKSGDGFYRVIPFQILSWAPRLVLFPAFLDATRCDAIVEYGRVRLHKSGLAFKPGESGDDESQNIRTSSGVFISSEHEPTGALAWLEERIAAATLLPVGNGEPFNLLRYQQTQHYDSHLDAFDPKEYGPQDSQRVATALVYLSDVEEGGETIFLKEGWGNATAEIKDWRSCNHNQGLRYKPRKGDMVLFHDTFLNGEIDEHALHGGCPVVRGEKWAITKWIRDKRVIKDTAAEMEMTAKLLEATGALGSAQ